MKKKNNGKSNKVETKVGESGVEELLMDEIKEEVIPVVVVPQEEVVLPPIVDEEAEKKAAIESKHVLVPDFNEMECMTEVEKIIDGQLCKVKLYNEKFQMKGSIARGQLRAAKAFNVSIEHLKRVADKFNGRKLDNVFINDLIGRHGFYDGAVMSRADLGRKTNTSLSQVEVAVQKLKGIVKRQDFANAYIEYLDFEKKLANLSEEEKLRGGTL